MFATCARQCLNQWNPGSPVVVEEQHGLAVVGTLRVVFRARLLVRIAGDGPRITASAA
jgi:hypothetical protein